MPYVVVAVETSVAWTTVDVTTKFEDRTLTLRPGSATLYPTVVLKYDPHTQEAHAEAIAVVRRFLSSLAWVERFGIQSVMTGGGGFPVQLGRSDVHGVQLLGNWRADYLPEPADDRGRLALALYREALVLEHVSVPYSFLGFFKILNIGLPNGNKQKGWTNAAIPKIKDHRAVQRIVELRGTVPDLGEYLYESGRCATAHAFNDPIVNPDNVADTLRLARDLPVAQALAEHFIETQLGIKTYSTVLSEHLYELDGFRAILGDDLVARLKANEAPPLPQPPPAFPSLTIRLDGRDGGVEFANMITAALGISEGAIVLFCASQDGRLKLALGLDFVNERLVFDPEREIRIKDDGSVDAVDHGLMRLRFFRGLVLNGRTEVVRADTGERLGRTDAYVGMNIDLNGTIENLDAAIASLTEIRTTRAAPQAK